MIIWLVRDPETERIALQDSEPDDGARPLGLRGRGWEIRQGEIEEDVWRALLAGEISPADQDELHQRLWEEAE